MSQANVLTYLENNRDRWFSVQDISKALDVGKGAIMTNMKKLRRWNQVEYGIFSRNNLTSVMKYKHKSEEGFLR